MRLALIAVVKLKNLSFLCAALIHAGYQFNWQAMASANNDKIKYSSCKGSIHLTHVIQGILAKARTPTVIPDVGIIEVVNSPN